MLLAAALVPWLSLTPLLAAELPAPTHAISPQAPWARAFDDALSRPLVEQWYGPEVGESWRDIEPQWDGNRLLTRDSYDDRLLASLGVPPVPAMNYEPSPGVIYVAMDGVTLEPTCGNGDAANSALNCSPLVDAPTTFGAFEGGQAAAEYEQLRQYYDEFDLVLTTNRPPDYLPYTMAVVGGTAGQAGFDNGTCGVANVACDGLKRNHVSLNFSGSCGGMAEIAAQETSHNWGLEHTANPTDLLYPFNNGGFKTFVDNCMNISAATGDGITQCGYIHEIYCEAGGGEQQNTYAELMGIFGPKTVDETDPQIVSISPPSGSVFSTTDTISITASITDDSRFLGIKWTWLEGLPPDYEEYTRCTNNTCTEDYNPGPSFEASEIPWDFVGLDQPPAGTYAFQLEVIDSYGNYATETITIEVTADGEPSDDGGTLDDSGGAEGATGSDDLPGGTGGEDGSMDDGTGGAAEGGQDGGSGVSDGCRIVRPVGPGAGLWGLVLLGMRRRRRD